jgi:DNA helicase HerA-like ATPase
LLTSPTLYATFLLWMMSELFERLPEVGDPDKPKLVFFFDEAHLLFNDLPSSIQQKVEQVVRLIRSKGVGIYFVTQSPTDIPDVILGQLGNRVQHALRAFTPKDQKAVRAAAETFRANPKLLDEKGMPSPVERALVVPPHSQIGPITPDQRSQIMKSSVVAGVYDTAVDRESAYELLKARSGQPAPAGGSPGQPATTSPATWLPNLGTILGGGNRRGDSLAEAAMKSAARAMGSSVGRQIIRGVLGSLLGGSRRR